jgi:hypothetical protein
VRMGVDGTGSGPCPVAGFGISGVEPSGSATRVRYVCCYIVHRPVFVMHVSKQRMVHLG